MSRYYDSSKEIYRDIPDAPFYVCSNDSFLSDWGPAKGKTNTCVVPCPTHELAEKVVEYAKSRDDQKYIRITSSKPRTKPGVIYSLVMGWIDRATEPPPKQNTDARIEIHARRWFQKTYGNTYHSCRVYVEGELVGHAPYSYGYGDQYLTTALELLQEAGEYQKTGERHASGMSKDYGEFTDDMRNNPDKFIVSCIDVDRKKDL